MFGITDYFSFENYFEVTKRYKERYPQGTKIFFLNIEFRLTETVSSDAKNVHSHVIFNNDPDICNPDKMRSFLSNLRTHQTHDNGAYINCLDLQKSKHYESATVSIEDLKRNLKKVFGHDLSYLIVTAANNDGLRGVDTKSQRSKSISDELDKSSHAFFGNAQNTEWFLKANRYEGKSESVKKPVFSGSDAHSFDDLERLSGDEPNYAPTWIKADLTFRGLCQSLYEPKGRVYIGDKPPLMTRQEREATKFINCLKINSLDGYNGKNGKWFQNVEIPLNPELVAIIGNKGSGKSAVADILGLLGESKQEEHFSFLTNDTKNKKFRCPGYAENFEGKLKWQSGNITSKGLDENVDILKSEAVKYLPQNYFENLTNEIEVKFFRTEIEDVVFSHVEEEERMETSSFSELENLKTEQSKSDISALKTRLRELNLQITELEAQINPSYKKQLQEQLNVKKGELLSLQKSRPKEPKKPDSETKEQKAVAEQITKLSEVLNLLSTRGKSSVEKLALNAEEIIKYHVDLSFLDQKISDVHSEIKSLDRDNSPVFTKDSKFNEIVSVPDLRTAYEYISGCIKNLKETLSAPQKRYQSYLQAIAEIQIKEEELQGNHDELKPGTIKYLENKISYIEKDLQKKIDEKLQKRDDLSKLIFESKKKVQIFYEGLKNSVEKRLQDVSSDDFQVTIDASFILNHEFENHFFDYINRNKKGHFRGKEDGKEELQKLLSCVCWNGFESVLAFAKRVIELIKQGSITDQVKDVKKFYDFLFSFEYFDTKYELRLGGKNLNQLSPGEKGLLLLVFYLHLDKEKTPLGSVDKPDSQIS